MRFVSPRDYQSIVKINQELLNKVVDTTVVIYKIQQTLTKRNSYDEAPKKVWFAGVEVPALIALEGTNAAELMDTVDTSQAATFAFLREELKIREIYPETGDVIFYDAQYYEIHNTNETQKVAGRVEYSHSIVCETHLTRITNLQIEPPIL
jgi:hypothetical protein